MSQKQTTTQANQYNPGALTTYQNLQGPAANMQNSLMSSPRNNPLYNMLLNKGRTANQYQTSGIPGTPGNAAATAQLQRQGMQRQGMTNNALLIGSANLRNSALNSAMNYRPLQTGGTQTQTTSGLGTWLPQVIGLGVAAGETAMGMPPRGAPKGDPGGGSYPSSVGNTLNPMMSPPQSPFFSNFTGDQSQFGVR